MSRDGDNSGQGLIDRLRGLLRRGGRVASAGPAAVEAPAAPAGASRASASKGQDNRTVHLPTVISWSSSPSVKHTAAGAPYLTVPLEGGATFRSLRPNSTGWTVPARHIPGTGGAAGAGRFVAANPFQAAGGPGRASVAARPAAAAAKPPSGARRGLVWLMRWFGG